MNGMIIKENQTRWVVTGCNGYLGGEICSVMHTKGYTVIGVSRTNRNIDDLLRQGITCVSYEELPKILSPLDCFVHCAGKTGFDGLWEDYERVNVRWSEELFTTAIKSKVNTFIYISSIAAMGYMNRPGCPFLNEDSVPILHRYEYYGRSKLLAEEQLEFLNNNTTTRLIILRPGLIYGRRINQNKQTWLRRSVIIKPDSIIPFTHIDNFISALTRISMHDCSDQVFLVVDDEQPTQNDLIHLKTSLGLIKYSPWRLGLLGYRMIITSKKIVENTINKKTTEILPSIEPLILFHSRKIRYDCKRLKQATGWRPHISLRQGWQQIAGQIH